MSNGAVCCARFICCPPLRRMRAVVDMFTKWIGEAWRNNPTISDDGLAKICATKLLAEHELAPVGISETMAANWKRDDATLGAAIRALYADDFKALAAHKGVKH